MFCGSNVDRVESTKQAIKLTLTAYTFVSNDSHSHFAVTARSNNVFAYWTV